MFSAEGMMGTDDAEIFLSNVPVKTRRNELMMTIMFEALVDLLFQMSAQMTSVLVHYCSHE